MNISAKLGKGKEILNAHLCISCNVCYAKHGNIYIMFLRIDTKQNSATRLKLEK